ncbi:hypothetical protein JOD29_000331 [Lysinibacillus composti]|uniref:Uncharacterized protein n=1 Tax=Lysinibacillus composti TaxID=720633 RepID=A0A3N9UV40_9BACI|nr:hypothetical protein [Lysinibacillus composti]MBM7607094.1 hypothetical protein [Lysinibacillus composti]RQW76312.1 hypothetical protein EBB45_01835 [Lysinibacillus composti]
MKRTDFYWELFKDAVLGAQILKRKHGKDTLNFVARDLEGFSDGILKNKETNIVNGDEKTYKQVAIRLDNPQKFKQYLEQKNLL